jgi:hypothetical protein
VGVEPERKRNTSFKGKESVFSISKLFRSKLYGRKRRISIDEEGNSCTRVLRDVAGGILLKKGMTGQGYLDDKGNWLERDTITGVDAEGEVPTFHKLISGPQTREAGSIYAAGVFG